MNILVLCTGNSARSILLESIFNTKSNGRITAFSAGSQPAGKVHPQSLKLLGDLGHNTQNLKSKSWDVFAEETAPTMDAVITVCASAAGEACPYWPGAPVTAHWGVEDPAKAAEEDWDAAFQTAYDKLHTRAVALFDEAFEEMDASTLKATLNRIGTL